MPESAWKLAKAAHGAAAHRAFDQVVEQLKDRERFTKCMSSMAKNDDLQYQINSNLTRGS